MGKASIMSGQRLSKRFMFGDWVMLRDSFTLEDEKSHNSESRSLAEELKWMW